MSKLIELIKAYLPRLQSQKDVDDSYLKESVDIFDLEHRMQTIDNRSSGYCLSHWVVAMKGR